MDTAANELIEGLRREHAMWLLEILNANQDFEQRVSAAGGFTVEYDPADDLLMLTLGRPVDAATETFGNVIAVRYDPDSLKIVGLEILGLRANMLKRPEFSRLYEQAVRDPEAAARTARTLMTA